MNARNEYNKGLAAAFGCAALWGILPIYWKSLIPISSSVIIIYRIFLVWLMALIFARRKYSWDEIKAPAKDRRLMLKMFAAGVIITANWSTYIWAVNAGFIIQTSIGYYIEPIAVCLFGMIIFHEKLTKYKGISLGLAILAVLIILVYYRQLPGIALGLAGTFSVYSAIKKTVSLPPFISLFYETVFLAPFALAIVFYLEATGKGALGSGEAYQYGLLMLCGLVTVVPLGLFAFAAQRVSLFALGIAEYISPSLQLVVGILLYHETIDKVQMVAFIIIWIGLVFFSYGEYITAKRTAENGEAA
jgi:chloramphenicol-sensitive protein RarD